ncbi:MAG: MBL fold metallo-hydrolase [Chitinophagales bacterium]
MKAKWWKYQLDELTYYRFSIYHFGTNMQTVYLYRFGENLVDTAQRNSRENIDVIIEDRPIKKIFLTHYHEDHTGNAAYLQKKFDAEIYAHPICAKLMTVGFTVSPLGRVISGSVRKAPVKSIEDGEIIQLDNYQLQAIHTPGHTDDHMAYYEANRGWLFSGDIYVADRIKYFESNEDIKIQINSLKKLVALDFDVLFCAHNPKLKGGKKRLQRKLELFEAFYNEVLRLNSTGLDDNEILKALGRKENYFYKFMTVGHFTAVNMVKSVLKAEGRV